jgi:hypothetical protein
VLLHAALLRRCLSALSEPYTLRPKLKHPRTDPQQRGFRASEPNLLPSQTSLKEFPMESPIPSRKLAFNVDAAAIVIALTFAALIRLGVIHHIGW